MTKIQKKINESIPYQRYFIDSFKLLIDSVQFKSVNIPENFILVSADSGDIVREFKQSSMQIAYKNTTIYLGLFRRILKGSPIEKVILLFSSKVSDNYFYGIRKQDVIDVLLFLQSNKYIDFDNVNDVYKNLYSKDVDIKIDFKFSKSDREKIADYNTELASRFQHEKNEIHKYNAKDNLGLQTFNRERSTLAHPFLKFYDKTKEINKKHIDFFMTLPSAIQDEIRNNFIYRFEFTMRDNKFFKKFALSNRLEEVLEVLDTKWSEIAKTLLNANFEVKMKRSRDTSKLNYYERILALHIYTSIHKHNISPAKLKIEYTACQHHRNSKVKAAELFDKIYQHATQDEVIQISKSYEDIQRFDKIFGLMP